MDIKVEKDFFNKIVKDFYIEYSDHTVKYNHMPYPHTVNFWVWIQPKDVAQIEKLKQRLAKYGIKAVEDVLCGDRMVRFVANHDDEIISALNGVLQQRANAKAGMFKRASGKFGALAQKVNRAFRSMFPGNQKKR